MSNTRSTLLRPLVSLSALLVVASMVVAAPASAGWKTHRAPAFERAVIAVHATNRQAIDARRLEADVLRRMRAADRHVVRAAATQQAILASARVASADGIALSANVLIDATRTRIVAERQRAGLERDLAYTRTLVRQAEARRGTVLAGLSLAMRQRVMRAEHRRSRQAAARRGAARDLAILDPIVPAPAHDPGAELAAALAAPAPTAAPSGVGAIAAAYALTQLGVPYRAAGMSPEGGFDCSGLLYWAFAQAGMGIPRSSGDIWRAGRRIPRAQAEPGDIVSFHGEGHVGIYLGSGLYVHSTKSGDVVRVHALSDRRDLDGFVRLR